MSLERSSTSQAPASTSRDPSPAHQQHQQRHGQRPHLGARVASALTGTTSGSATPSTSYGSFPPGAAAGPPSGTSVKAVEDLLRDKLAPSRSSSRGQGSKHRSKLDTTSEANNHRRRWTRSRERLLVRDAQGRVTDDVYDSDNEAAALSDDDEEEVGVVARDFYGYDRKGRGGEGEEDEDPAEPWRSVNGKGRPAASSRGSKGPSVPDAERLVRRSRRSSRNGGGGGSDAEDDKQWGVVKMELMAKTWGRKGFLTVYAGVYLISALISLEGNTTPTIEPYFLSLLGEHSMLSSVVIVMSIAYAVGKPPMTKVLDVFGRAEGVCFAAALYSLGYLITAGATDVKVYVFARALSALGGQGIQLAQQIIVADTTTLSNRGLITSTVSVPWLITTWIGPPLGAFFQRQGPAGYRAAYAVFGILLPLVAGLLFCTLWLEWRKIRRKALEEGRKPCTREMGFGVTTRQHRREHRGSHSFHVRPATTADPSRLDVDLERTLTHENNDHPYLASQDPTLSARERREASAAETAAQEMTKRKRWNMTTWSKAVELWKDLDVLGLVALTVGCILFLLPFTLATKRPESWGDSFIWILILSGAAILVFFGFYERHAAVPLIPPRLLKNRTILSGSAIGFFHFCSQFCYESFFTSFLQVARGHSPQDASYISQSYIFSACVSAIIAGYLAKVTKRYKWVGISGVLIHIVGVWLMMRSRDLDAPTWELALSQVIGGVGGGFTTIAVQTGCQSVVGHQDVAIATAIFLTITQVGGAVGGSIAGAVWSTYLPRRLHYHLPADGLEHIPRILASLPYALSFPPGSPIRLGIDKAYVDVQRVLNGLAMSMLLPGLIAMCSMRNVNLAAEDHGVGEGVVVLGRASFLACEEDELTSSETSSLLGPVHEQQDLPPQR
ncbi:hypothetical protein JCM10908_001413 [Rhodotorula pacifica]|uniref:uncharacterized protein n=1 Tax=Rhodotorula pacifica TaxID=1495444 RepID=UPI00317F96D0